ncbi:MAG: class I SAM-dependent methyltransferase [Thermoplasmata archaeon]
MSNSQMVAWDREYHRRGRLWRGEQKDADIISPYLSKGPILDSGCGNGKGSPDGGNVVALDFSRNALRLHPSEMKVLGDMRALPFKDSVFSSVLFIHSLGHLSAEHRLSALAEGSRVLREGGIMAVRVFSRSDFRYGKGKEVEEGTFMRGNGIITHYFNKEELLPAENMKIERFEKINYNINIHSEKYLREEFIIIFKKLKSQNS